jgi:hypothetical protein
MGQSRCRFGSRRRRLVIRDLPVSIVARVRGRHHPDDDPDMRAA